MKSPPHIGGLLRREVIEPLGLTVTEAARVLGVGRQALSSLLNGKVALTSEMGLRVEKACGPKLEHLMRMPLAYDLAQARKTEHGVRVRRYVAIKLAAHGRQTRRRPRASSILAGYCLAFCLIEGGHFCFIDRNTSTSLASASFAYPSISASSFTVG
jgi:addiction module HigA family antidote